MQQAGQAQILQGDAIEVLRTLPDESVQCVVTSPPYFGLRDYGTAEWDGGDAECDHRRHVPQGAASSSTLRPAGARHHHLESAEVSGLPYGNVCGKCGATRIDQQIGLESTPAEYVEKMVTVFREVRRVLRKDGVCWLNMGDSYAGGGNYRGINSENTLTDKQASNRGARGLSQELGALGKDVGVAAKNLLGMPWRLAFALQSDGWYLRQDIIWAKPNPMPESVTDRCTKAHEYVFLLSKSERYFYDAEAIAEEAAGGRERFSGDQFGSKGLDDLGRNDHGRVDKTIASNRNKRSVWTITTEPYPEAHFATFPTELPRICILAGSKIGDTILDPFAGSGTTLQVALELSRAAIGIELNEEYVALANRRLNSTTLGLPLEIAA